MSVFQANFEIYPTLIYAPVKLEFSQKSTIGSFILSSSETAIVDENYNILNIPIDISNLRASDIMRYEWDFGDGYVSDQPEPTKVYEIPKTYTVSLSIYSNTFFDSSTSQIFRVKHTTIKEIVVGSMTYSWLMQHALPMIKTAMTDDRTTKDFYEATSRLFDRMYSEIKQLSNIMDIETVDPNFLKYFSDTLGHSQIYSKKVGYDQQNFDSEDFVPFFDYDIFERIENKTASSVEIDKFRQFILDTALLYKTKGTIDAIEKFFTLFGFVVNIQTLWTKDFGETKPNAIVDNYFFDTTLKNSPNKFEFRGISVNGINNESAVFWNEINTLNIDNYHYISTHHIQDMENINCFPSFLINDISPYVKGVIRDDGRQLSQTVDCITPTQPNNPGTTGTSATTGTSGTSGCPPVPFHSMCFNSDYITVPNNDWIYENIFTQGVTYKLWKMTDGYVQTLIDTLGILPIDPDESHETIEPNDDYIWASWDNGITVPENVPGYKNLIKPSLQQNFNNINFKSSLSDNSLISNIDLNTERDLFVVARCFLHVTTSGYYIFNLNIGNLSDFISTNHVAFVNLGHKQKKSFDEIVKTGITVDNFIFERSSNILEYNVSHNGTPIVLSTKDSEYGIIEIRSNESVENSGYYYLEEGYYPLEIKSTYNSSTNKALILKWERWNQVNTGIPKFIQQTFSNVIPSSNLLSMTFRENTIQNTYGKGIMYLDKDAFEGNDSLKVIYTHPNTEKTLSGIISNNDTYKNFDISVKFETKPSEQTEELIKRIQNKVGVIFRAINNGDDLYSSIDTYYSFELNFKNNTYSLIHVGYDSTTASTYRRYLNLNNLTTIEDVEYERFIDSHTLIEDVVYTLKIHLIDDTITVTLLSDTTEIILLDALNINQNDALTQVRDYNDIIIDIPNKYEVIGIEGYYGLYVSNGLVKLYTYSIKTLDDKDYFLYTHEEKLKNVKPEFLEYRPNEVIQYNSYETSVDGIPPKPLFKYTITNEYNNESSFDVSHIENISDGTVDSCVIDNLDITSQTTRFNILLNHSYLTERFESVDAVKESIYVQFGRVFEPYVNWSSNNKNTGYYPLVTKSSIIYPHTKIHKNNTYQEFTNVNRQNNILYADTTLNEYLLGTKEYEYNGFWEEVCPYSTNETWTVPTLGTIQNPVFNILRDGNNNKIGLHFKSLDVLKKTCNHFGENSIIWGHYTISFINPLTTETFFSYQNSEISSIDYYVPIGVLKPEQYILIPDNSIFTNTNIQSISLNGVYINRDMEYFSGNISDTQVSFNIVDMNIWEKEYKSKIKTKYYFNITTSFIRKLEKYHPVSIEKNTSTSICDYSSNLINISLTKDCSETISNVFFQPTDIDSLLNNLHTLYESIDESYTWWNPIQLWYGRNFEVNKVKQLIHTIKLTDNHTIDSGKYITDQSWSISTVGWDDSFGLSITGSDISLDGYNNYIEIQVKKNSPVLLFESDDVDTNIIDIDNTDISITPYGLFNWISKETPTTESYDKEFDSCFNFVDIYHQIDASYYDINKYLLTNESLPENTLVKVNYTLSTTETSTTIPVGVSDGINNTYILPPFIEDYLKWEKLVNSIVVDNYTMNKDLYYISTNKLLTFNHNTFNFTQFVGESKISLLLYSDKIFTSSVEELFKDNFNTQRDFNWITCIKDEKDIYSIATKLPNDALKYTTNSLPYNIHKYNGSYVMSSKDVFDHETNIYSGSINENKTIEVKESGSSVDIMYLHGVESNDYSISFDFIFDKNIELTDYLKQFEIIIKAENTYSQIDKKYNITDFYYVGTNTYNFDIGLGMRSVDNTTGEVKETFLASFGDYNARNIKSNVYYTITAKVSNNNIRIFFNERNQPEQFVLNYSIDYKYEKLTDRYLKGHYESLERIVIGLQQLKAVYPITLPDMIGDQYTFDNFKEEFASTLPVNGTYTGFRLYNPLTYVSEVRYIINKPKQYTFGSAYRSSSFNQILDDIKRNFALPDDAYIVDIKKTLDGTLYIQINNQLYYQVYNQPPQLYKNMVESFQIWNDKIFIIENHIPNDCGIGINTFTSGENTIRWNLDVDDYIYNVQTYNDLILTIPNCYKLSIYKKVLDQTYIIEIVDSNIIGPEVQIEQDDIITIFIEQGKQSVWPLSGVVIHYDKIVKVYTEKMVENIPVYIKDKTFYTDTINNYMNFTDKQIKEIHINDGIFNVIFKDN